MEPTPNFEDISLHLGRTAIINVEIKKNQNPPIRQILFLLY